tara:strand:+ start:980 stop:1150 length:171 start_codon:yes stop_codon:yes gene_type:complete
MPAKKPQTQSYTALEPLLHNGTKYAPGQSIDLTTDQANAMRTKKLVGDLVKEEGAE